MGSRNWKALASYCCIAILLSALPAQAQSDAGRSTGNLALIRDAAQAIAAGDLQRAETELNVVLAAVPNEYRALNLMGIVRAQQRREPEAEKLLRRSIELNPAFASAHVSLGMLYVQMARPDDAIVEFQEALRLDADRSDARSALVNTWREEARAAVGRNDPEKALSLLLRARKTESKDPDVLYDFGMVALQMSLFPDAVQAFQEALTVRKDDARAVYGLGRAQMALANYDDARATFQRYVEMQPADASGRYALGMTLESLQQFADARDEFQKSIALQPAQTESYFQLGQIELEAGNLAAAETQLNRVLSRDPHHAGALAALGRLKFQQKDYIQARDDLEKAVAANIALREAHYYLGMTYARLNRKEDSDKELAIATQLEHQEVERHQNQLRILNSDQLPANEPGK